jgi:hypothetical protein
LISSNEHPRFLTAFEAAHLIALGSVRGFSTYRALSRAPSEDETQEDVIFDYLEQQPFWEKLAAAINDIVGRAGANEIAVSGRPHFEYVGRSITFNHRHTAESAHESISSGFWLTARLAMSENALRMTDRGGLECVLYSDLRFDRLKLAPKPVDCSASDKNYLPAEAISVDHKASAPGKMVGVESALRTMKEKDEALGRRTLARHLVATEYPNEAPDRKRRFIDAKRNSWNEEEWGQIIALAAEIGLRSQN